MKYSFVLFLTWFIALQARVIKIPADYPSIQQGLNAASAGDTVLVAPGVYHENINWPSVDGIKLDSETGATSTIIDGDTLGGVIVMGAGITDNTVVNGFTIRDGKATVGGGIRLTDASPTVSNNKICYNSATGGSYSYGGGIYCYSTGISVPRVIANQIFGNKVIGTSWNHGGGIYIGRNSRAIVCYNTIEQDSAIGGYWNYGAGVYCDMDACPFIYQNVIRQNVGIRGDRAHGAGIFIATRGYPIVFNNLIVDNRANSGSWNYGAGIRVDSGGIIINNTLASNVCTGGTWNYGGGIFLDGINNYIYNNIIVNNQGGGIYNYDPITTQSIDYNDVWNNSPTNYYNCTPGPNDRSRDPVFVVGARGNYYLSQIRAGQPVQSPCVDSGGILVDSLLAFIRASTTRTDSVPDSNNVDMGYHYPIGGLVWINEGLVSSLQPSNMKIQISPNPFVKLTKVSFSTGHSAKSIELKIYDVSGRVVKDFKLSSLVQVPMARSSIVTWHGDDNSGRQLPAGVYFLRVQSGSISSGQKVILIR